jgi:hypothetical protein
MGATRSFRRSFTRRRGALVTLAIIVACTNVDPDAQRRAAQAPYAQTDSMGVIVTTRTIAVRAPRALVENSGTAMSATQPGIVFTFNDSDNDPMLFALDTTGAARGIWRLVGARNDDWEAASIGPCGSDPAALAVPRCVYVGDVGDNEASKRSRVIYRVREPTVGDSAMRGEIEPERLTYRYEDHAHDVEAIYVGPRADVFIITKRPLRSSLVRLRPALVFSIPASAWSERGDVVARLVDSLPLVPGSAPLRQITDAALSPDARWLAVRTYAQVFVFATDTASGRVITSIAPTVCNVIELGEQQGEGIGWLGVSGELLLTSEGNDEPFRVIDCPRPSRTGVHSTP